LKVKLLSLIFVIFLVLVLVSCQIVPIGLPEWMRAEAEVQSYWEAITNRRYELAKYYCILDGIWYNKVDEREEYIDANSGDGVSLTISPPHFSERTEVVGDNAIANITIFVDKITFPNDHPVHRNETFIYEVELIRSSSGFWKLK